MRLNGSFDRGVDMVGLGAHEHEGRLEHGLSEPLVPARHRFDATAAASATPLRRLRRGFGLLGERRERGGARDGELRQALAIERDAGVLQAVDELPVGEAVLARGGVDADDPQPAEIALLAAAADERVLERGVDRLFRGAIQLALVGVIALRQAKQLLALGPTNCSSFYTRHLLAPTGPVKPDTTETRLRARIPSL